MFPILVLIPSKISVLKPFNKIIRACWQFGKSLFFHQRCIYSNHIFFCQIILALIEFHVAAAAIGFAYVFTWYFFAYQNNNNEKSFHVECWVLIVYYRCSVHTTQYLFTQTGLIYTAFGFSGYLHQDVFVRKPKNFEGFRNQGCKHWWWISKDFIIFRKMYAFICAHLIFNPFKWALEK